MTERLEEALRRVACLSSEEQDAIASQIIALLDDEEAWACGFGKAPAAANSHPHEAAEEQRGDGTPLEDELIE